ncbi:MAG: replicative DNA helicase [Clostridia bacterium]|nr:replicative DNA helicase [Clostridia bacterium]
MNEEIQRKLPFSLEAEQSVLGAVLIDPNVMDVVTGIITDADFFMEENRELFLAMQNMYRESRSIDLVMLIDEVSSEAERKASDRKDYSAIMRDKTKLREYIKVIAQTVPTATNVKDYANIVRDKAKLRSLITACEEVITSAYAEEDTADALVELAESKIYGIAEEKENKNFIHIRDAIVETYDRLKLLRESPADVLGMPTGFKGLDRVLIGLGKGDLVLVGARPGMGKTSFAMNLATAAAKSTGKAVCVFSLEMSAEQLASRILSSEALVDSRKLRKGELSDEDWKSLAYAASELSECNILIDDTPGVTVAGIRSKLRRVKNRGMVVIDYLQLMQSERRIDNKVQEVAEISRGLKLLAKEFEIPIICCAQLSRGPESRNDKRPMLSDLRDSGAIEQDADMVLFLYRDEYYKEPKDGKSVAEVIVAKNRHGSVGKVEMGWIGEYTKFSDLAPEEPAGAGGQ